jgi:membrane protease YdiL (CAAX protease family)
VLAAVALVAARLVGLSAADLGLARRRWMSGLRWGGAAAALVLAAYGIAATLVDDVAEPRYDSVPEAILAVLVLIPLGTVIPEELVFRGVLWGWLGRARGTRVATGVSSMLFGLWHVVPALSGGPANDALTGAVGSGTAGTILRVLGTVAFTTVAGVVLCYVRQRSDSLLAPILLHWAANGAGVLFVLLA